MPGQHMMWDYFHMWGWGGMWLGWFWRIGIVLLILWGIYAILRSDRARRDLLAPHETPLDILKKRYARGEITKEQFDEMKRHIEE